MLSAGGVAVADHLTGDDGRTKQPVVRDLTAGRSLSRSDAASRTSRNSAGDLRTTPIGKVSIGRAAQAALSERQPPRVVASRYATADLNVWTRPTDKSTLTGLLKRGTKVAITGKTLGAWAEIVIDGRSRWVHTAYLVTSKPAKSKPPVITGTTISAAPCPASAGGSAVEQGLTPDAIRVHRAVCAQFPQITRYLGIEGAYPHSAGLAVDIMTTDSTLGDQIAEWVRANHARLGASEVIYAQHIWTVERSSEGWRLMPDRGSVTANHYDHVHVTVYGSAGG